MLERPLSDLQLKLARPEIAGLRIAGPLEPWAALGFTLDGSLLRVGEVTLELGCEGEGIVDWVLRDGAGQAPGSAQAHPEGAGQAPGSAQAHPEGAGQAPPAAPVQPNGVSGVDHVVLVTAEFDATAARLERSGIPFRRVRDVPARDGRPAFRQGFRRMGPVILEVVEVAASPSPAPTERFWGITFTAADLDALAARLGRLLGPVRDAVQPGRRIAALRSAAGVGCPVAFITPEQPSAHR